MNSIVISDVYDNVIRVFLFLFAFLIKTVDQNHLKYRILYYCIIIVILPFSLVTSVEKFSCVIKENKTCNHLSKSHMYNCVSYQNNQNLDILKLSNK